MIRSLLILVLLASPAWSQCGDPCIVYPGYSSGYESRGLFRSERSYVHQPSVVVRQQAASNVVVYLSDGGSGLILKTGPEGEVLSCAHGLKNGAPKVRMPDGSWQQAAIIDIDQQSDLALFRVNVTTKHKTEIATELPRAGEAAGWEGYPGGRHSAREGRVAEIVGINGGTNNAVTLNIPAYSGCSGGSLYRVRDGKVIGVLSGTDGRSTIGAHCLTIQAFLAKARGTNQSVVEPPAEKTVVDVGPMVAVLSERIEKIETRLVAVESREYPVLPGPAGPQGEPGKDGADGKDGRDGKDGQTPEIDYERLAAEVMKLQPQPESQPQPVFWDIRPRQPKPR